jgi:hypothetical protein
MKNLMKEYNRIRKHCLNNYAKSMAKRTTQQDRDIAEIERMRRERWRKATGSPGRHLHLK